ncbi:MAG: GEGP motif-containing diheme protein [Desulfomonilia bacterium]
MKKVWIGISIAAVLFLVVPMAFSAYHHEGEMDADKFLTAYPNKAGTKLDHCALCHSGGSYVDDRGRTNVLGSCQWCHYSYGYDGSGSILDTMNEYGIDYHDNGRNAAAITAINSLDSDGDGYTNAQEILANTYPGNPNDNPSLEVAPYRIYTLGQLEAMDPHTQFLLMNTSRSGDFYAEYTGVPMKDLLDDAGILSSATGILVYAPDGWSQYHPLEYDADIEMYHVYGNEPGKSYQYPPTTYFYDVEADVDLNPEYGWCDYSAPSCVGRSNGSAITVEGGLKAILAYKREGSYLDIGQLDDENRLDGEGPFRVVVPQKYPNAPDQSSRSDYQDVIWPNNWDWDHNAGACSRSATIIKVQPLPQGTTDIDILEAGWSYVDQGKIIIYGAIDGTDSNGNGILDSEEAADPSSDYDNDGIPDYQDFNTALLRHANGIDQIILHTPSGQFANMEALDDSDTAVTQTGKPSMDFPYGVVKFTITGLTPGQTMTVSLVFPDPVPTDAKYYKITAASGWVEVPFGSNDGDEVITLTLTDGDATTDADGLVNRQIVDPGALAVPAAGAGDDDDDDGLCFITTALSSSPALGYLALCGCLMTVLARFTYHRKQN